MTTHTLLAGAGRAEINFLPGDFPLKAFTGLHDAISVRVLLFQREQKLALVSIEMTSLPAQAVCHFRQVCARAAGLAAEQVLISVSHTFSAPHIPAHCKTEQEQTLSDRLYARLDEALRQAAQIAVGSLAETTVEYGEISCCLNVNRNVSTPQGWWLGRSEEGVSDHTVRVVNLRHGQTLFARLINYDIQPSVMDQSESAAGGRLISGDMAGAACRALEQEPGVTAVFLPGCAGDQAPLARAVQDGHDLHEAGFVLTQTFGDYLAERVRRTDTRPTEDGPLTLTTVMARLPEQRMKFETKALRPHTDYIFELTGGFLQIPLTLVTLGRVRLLATSPELNSAFGAQLRALLGGPLLIGTLVNGAVKYLPQAQDFERITYTAMNTTLGPGSEQHFLQAARTLR